MSNTMTNTMTNTATTLDENKLNALMGKMLEELGAIQTAPLVRIGERLGLYKAMAGAGPLTPAELAARTDTDTRYVREWLCNQAASGYIEYDAETGRFLLPNEQAMIFAHENSPVCLLGCFDVIAGLYQREEKLINAFRTGQGVGWHEQEGCLIHGIARFYGAAYRAHLVSEWLPALEGILPKLEAGALVADVGCGHGISTTLMAEAFPRSTFIGFDFHPASIEQARERARSAEVADRASFEVAAAKAYPGRDYDLVTTFDALHDMGDPVGAAAHVRQTLASDGTWMIVEPRAGDRIEENLNPVGRLFYGGSTMICTPCSKAQEVGLALGAQAGEARLREVVQQGGFTRFRRATETPFYFIFEARP